MFFNVIYFEGITMITTTPIASDAIIVPTGTALIIGASGGIGAALAAALVAQGKYQHVISCSRNSALRLDLCDETSIAAAAAQLSSDYGSLALVINATGVLSAQDCVVEKSWRQIDPVSMARVFAINTIGPALLIKHFAPLLSKTSVSKMVYLSARVGSIGDNQLGGWYSYRASKAALNQLVHTAAIELKRSNPDAICIALHPGTVDTGLTKPFVRAVQQPQTPALAALRLLAVIDSLQADQSGGFFDHLGAPVMW